MRAELMKFLDAGRMIIQPLITQYPSLWGIVSHSPNLRAIMAFLLTNIHVSGPIRILQLPIINVHNKCTRNKVIKIFTIVSVIFMPPTLIASIYGMNFSFMPELDKKWGYPIAILSMVLSSMCILYYFKKRKWL